MKEDFVSFEIAKKLKEKGYPQVKKGVLAMYNEYGEWFSLARNLDKFEYLFEDFDDKDCVCPSIFQVLKWLREEKKIFIEIALSPDGYQYIIYTGLYCMATSCAYHFTFDGFYRIEDNYITYEQAAIAGIKYVINNLI